MIYEYGCGHCGHRFEVWAKMSDPAPTVCPQCEASGEAANIQKIISASSFALKGSGWYTTDYKRAPAAGTKPAESASATLAKAETPAKAAASEATKQ